MRTIPPALQAKLDSGATTLCRCWIVTRRDGAVRGFTDHDRDVPLLEVVCAAGAGLSGSDATQMFGMSVSGSEISGAFSAASLDESDLAAGLYDAAGVKEYLVDWSDPSLHVLLQAGVFGEVRRADGTFTVEIRGPLHRLAEETGRVFSPRCDADLGDARCGIDISEPEWKGNGLVTAAQSAASVIASGLDTFAVGWFSGGRLTWTSGANEGLSVEVKSHATEPDGTWFNLWQPSAYAIAVGDAFEVTAGCDKRFATCRARFNNAVNFRGFPHIPGNDFLISLPTPGEQTVSTDDSK